MYLDDFPRADVGTIATYGHLDINGRMTKIRRQRLGGGFFCYFIDETGRRCRKVYRAGNIWVSRSWLEARGYDYKCRHLTTRRRRKHRAEKIERTNGGLRFLLLKPHGMPPEKWEKLRSRYCELMEMDLPEPLSRKVCLPRGDYGEDKPRDWLGRWFKREKQHEQA
jgi:hypothetical protein